MTLEAELRMLKKRLSHEEKHLVRELWEVDQKVALRVMEKFIRYRNRKKSNDYFGEL